MGKAIFLITLLLSSFAFAATPGVTLQGRITRADGTPFSSTTQFRVQVLSPVEQCVLYDETQAKQVTDGLFTFTLNDDSLASDPTNNHRNDTSSTWSFSQVFANNTSFINCQTTGGPVTYTPFPSDERKVLVQFKDATMSTWDALPVATLTHSASSIDSLAIGGVPAANVLRVDAPAATMTNADYTKLKALIDGSSTQYAPGTPSGAVGYNGQRITNVGTPTAGTDATTKDYVDTSLATKTLDTSLKTLNNTTDAGKVLSWDGSKWIAATAASQWATQAGSALSYTAGNVGIGTTAPGAPLHVNGAATFGASATTDGAFLVKPSLGYAGVYNSSTGLLYGFSKQLPSPTGTATVGGYYKGLGIGGSTSSGTNPIFGVLNSAQAGNGQNAVAFTIYDTNRITTFNNVLDDGSGKIGIGTTAPSALLQVNSSASNANMFNIITGAASGYGANFKLDSTSTGGHQWTAFAAGTTDNIAVGGFGLYDNTAAKTRLAIDTSGNVGVGTTAPGNTLDVVGGGTFTSATTQLNLRRDATDKATFTVDGSGNLAIATTPAAGVVKVTNDFNVGGSVGVGVTTPLTKLHVGGSLMIGNGAETCTATLNGALRFNSSNIEFCTGTGWQVLASGGATGSSTTITGTSGITLNPAPTNGTVTISSGASSTGTTSGALVVGGGVGVTGNINAGGTITGSAVSATTGAIPTLTAGSSGDLTINGNTAGNGNIFLGVNGGRVGIGTTAPSVPLEVQGNALFNAGFGAGVVPGNAGVSGNQFKVGISTTGAPTSLDVSNTNASATGTVYGAYILRSGLAANGVGLFVNSTGGQTTNYSALFMGGNVGVGTTAPSAALHVNDSVRIDLNGLTTSYQNKRAFTVWDTANNASLFSIDGRKTTTTDIELGNTTNNWVRLGVGTDLNSTPASSRLDLIATQIYTTGTLYPNAMQMNRQGDATSVATQFGSGLLNFEGSDWISGALARPVQAQIGTVASTTTAGLNRLAFNVRNAANTATTEALSIQGDGAVGIGTTAPSGALTITRYIASATNFLTLEGSNGNAASEPAIAFTNSVGNVTTGRISSVPGSLYANSSMIIAVADSSKALKERMRIDVNGKVGIGTSSPNATLEVGGAILSTPNAIANTATSLDVSKTDTFTIATAPVAATDTYTLTGNVNGGMTTVVINDTISRTYAFTCTGTTRYKPANTATTSGSSTIYSILSVYNPTTTFFDCYVTWASGYQ